MLMVVTRLSQDGGGLRRCGFGEEPSMTESCSAFRRDGLNLTVPFVLGGTVRVRAKVQCRSDLRPGRGRNGPGALGEEEQMMMEPAAVGSQSQQMGVANLVDLSLERSTSRHTTEL